METGGQFALELGGQLKLELGGSFHWIFQIGRGIPVIGHFPDYINLSEQLGARKFTVPTQFWDKMTPAEQWGANQKFLDRIISRGENVRLATPLNEVRPGSVYEKELNYMFGKDYKLSSDGLWLLNH